MPGIGVQEFAVGRGSVRMPLQRHQRLYPGGAGGKHAWRVVQGKMEVVKRRRRIACGELLQTCAVIQLRVVWTR